MEKPWHHGFNVVKLLKRAPVAEPDRGDEKLLKKVYFLIFIIPFFLPGCTRNIKNISADVHPTESLIVGRIETVPVLREFALFEERSKTEDRIEIAGMGFGLTKAGKLENQGYLYKIVRPGTYVLRIHKELGGEYAQDDILRIEVPKGKLVYFGTIKIVIDTVASKSPRGYETTMMFKYHFVGINEDDTLKHFENQYPEAYSAYKDKIIRIPSPSRPKYLTSITLCFLSDCSLIYPSGASRFNLALCRCVCGPASP